MDDVLVDFGVTKAAWFKDNVGNRYEFDGGPPRPLTFEPLQGLLRT